MLLRLTILFALLMGIASNADVASRCDAAPPEPTSHRKTTVEKISDDQFVLPRIADEPPFDPIQAASYIDEPALQSPTETPGDVDTDISTPAEIVIPNWSSTADAITEPPLISEPDPSFLPELPLLDEFPPLGEDVDPLDIDPEATNEWETYPDGESEPCDDCAWTWQVLPDGLLYKSYLAGTREARINGSLLYDTSDGWLFDATLGGRVGVLRWGTTESSAASGWQVDVEGAAFVRLNAEEHWDVDSVDFRFGVPLTYRRGRWQWKTGYYHLSAHVGDEFLVRNSGFRRINYVRDTVFFGLGYFLKDDVRLYSELGMAFKTDGGAKPWELQFGADYSPACESGLRGAPYAAVNVHLREEVDFGGGVNVMAGWHWKGPITGSTFRAGLQYYNGKSTQYAFFRQHEELIGFGLWFDY